jgi:ABC-type nitrate/sulfonate/bicarbonate transport system permease component
MTPTKAARGLLGSLLRPPVLSLLGLIALWWLASLGQPRHILPTPSDVLGEIWRTTEDGGHVYRRRRAIRPLAIRASTASIGGGSHEGRPRCAYMT